MEPHSTSKPVTVPIVAACRAVSTTVSVLRASCERRRRPAKGRRSASASRRPGPASVSRSSTSRGGKGACLNGVAAAAAAMETEHAKAIGRQNLRGGNGADGWAYLVLSSTALSLPGTHASCTLLAPPRALLGKIAPACALCTPRLARLAACYDPRATTVPAAAAVVHASCSTLRGGGTVSVCAAAP